MHNIKCASSYEFRNVGLFLFSWNLDVYADKILFLSNPQGKPRLQHSESKYQVFFIFRYSSFLRFNFTGALELLLW